MIFLGADSFEILHRNDSAKLVEMTLTSDKYLEAGARTSPLASPVICFASIDKETLSEISKLDLAQRQEQLKSIECSLSFHDVVKEHLHRPEAPCSKQVYLVRNKELIATGQAQDDRPLVGDSSFI